MFASYVTGVVGIVLVTLFRVWIQRVYRRSVGGNSEEYHGCALTARGESEGVR